MFEAWKRNRLERRFSSLKLVWNEDFVEITPRWEKNVYLVTFKVHNTFLTLRQLQSLFKVIEDVFSTYWNKEDPNPIATFNLNDSTYESAQFVQTLIDTDLAAELKLLFAISGTYSIKHFGLEKTIALFTAQKKLYSGKALRSSLYSNMDLCNRALIILPGVGYDFDSARPVTAIEVERFFTSEHALKLTEFLVYYKNSELSFEKFKKMQSETLTNKDYRQLCTADLLIALEIVENSPVDKVDKLTATQILSLAREFQPGQAALYPMSIILSRLRSPRYESSIRSEIPCLEVLSEFLTSEELFILENKARDYGFLTRLARFSLFQRHGNADPMGINNTAAAILAVLAEIAVTKGVSRYSEVVNSLEEIFPIQRRNWETLEPKVRIRLVALITEALNEDYDDINFRWILEMNGHMPFDLGRICLYDRGGMNFL